MTQEEERLRLRECRARKKAQPELSREHYDIIVGHPYGALLKEYLESNGVSGIVAKESFADIIVLSSSTNLDQVDAHIQAWMKGGDFAPL